MDHYPFRHPYSLACAVEDAATGCCCLAGWVGDPLPSSDDNLAGMKKWLDFKICRALQVRDDATQV